MDDGVHYHMAIVIEGRCDTKLSLQHFLADLKKKGCLSDYKVISPRSEPAGQNLSNEKERDHFFFWLSYLAKEETKNSGEQSISRSKSVQNDLASWTVSGKPVLACPDEKIGRQSAQGCVLECFEVDHIGWAGVPSVSAQNQILSGSSGCFTTAD